MKRLLVIASAFAIAVSLAGCAQQPTNKAPAESTQQETAQVGDTIPVSTKNGDIEVTVEAFTDNAKATADMAQYGQIDEGQHVGLLKLVVKNVSYEDKNSSLPDYIKMASIASVVGPDGVNLNAMNSASDVGEYDGAAGGAFECKQGESKRVAIFYPIDAGITDVTVQMGNVSVPVTVPAE